MNLQGKTALVTGANRGLGKALVDALLDAGIARVYAGVRDPDSFPATERVVPVTLDVTDLESVRAAAAACPDVDLLINNAGIARGASLLQPASLEFARSEWETLCLGPLAMTQAFAPALARRGGGVVVNVLSALTWISMPGLATYSSAKTAAWSLTNGLRNELREQGTRVVGVHVGFMDTDLARGVPVPKEHPTSVAQEIVAALGRDDIEVLVDSTSKQLKAGLAAGAYLSDPTRPS